jgi:hypothetical protein
MKLKGNSPSQIIIVASPLCVGFSIYSTSIFILAIKVNFPIKPLSPPFLSLQINSEYIEQKSHWKISEKLFPFSVLLDE